MTTQRTAEDAEVLTRDSIDRLERNSIQAINDFLESDKVTKVMVAKAKVAQSALGSVQSRRHAQMARRSLDWTMARSLTSDPAQLAEYVRVTQPESPILRALPSKTA